MTHRAIEPAEQAAVMLTGAGMPRMPARVLMALIAAPAGGYTAAELAERLGVSAGSVSGALQYLRTVHFIQRRVRAGDRRDRYELVQDAFYGSVATNAPIYARMADFIDLIADEHDDDPAAHAKAVELSAFFRFMARRMPQLIQEWEAERDTSGR